MKLHWALIFCMACGGVEEEDNTVWDESENELNGQDERVITSGKFTRTATLSPDWRQFDLEPYTTQSVNPFSG